MKISIIFLSFISIVMLSIGCDSTDTALKRKIDELKNNILKEGLVENPKELNREMAKKILNRELSPEKKILKGKYADILFRFKKDQQKIAEQTLLKKVGYNYALSTKGKEVFGDLSNNIKKIWGGLGFDLKTPIPEIVVSIDGIAEGGPFGGGTSMKEVKFTTKYIFPENTSSEIYTYVYSGLKRSAYFRKYDDGWRCEKLN